MSSLIDSVIHGDIRRVRAKRTSNKLPERHLISWSGGNDSTVMLHYLLNQVFDEDADYRVFFMDTTITFEETIQYVKNIAELWGFENRLDIMRPEKTFFEMLRKNRFWPSIQALWCRGYLKDRVMKKYYMQQYRGERKKLISHIGVSIYDSSQRRKMYADMPEKDKIRKFGYAIVHLNYPILTWTDFKKARYRQEHARAQIRYKINNTSSYLTHIKVFIHLITYK